MSRWDVLRNLKDIGERRLREVCQVCESRHKIQVLWLGLHCSHITIGIAIGIAIGDQLAVRGGRGIATPRAPPRHGSLKEPRSGGCSMAARRRVGALLIAVTLCCSFAWEEMEMPEQP